MKFILDNITGKNQDKYAKITEEDVPNENIYDEQIGFINIENEQDIKRAVESIKSGYIVISSIKYAESREVKEKTIKRLSDVSEEIGGDIVHKKQNNIIVSTPFSVKILRSEL